MDATLYDELHRVEQTHWWFRARRHIVWSLVQRFIRSAPNRRLRICELGCGTGGNLAAVADKHDVVGVECSPRALAYARQTLGDRVRYGRLPHEIDLPPESFDVVLMTDVLEHVEDDVASAKTALELLRPGGIVVATVPAYQWLYSPRDAHHHHYRRYSKRRFARLWRHTAAITVLLSYYNTCLFPAAAAVRLLSKTTRRGSNSGDLAVPPQRVNDLLARIMRSEGNLLGRVPLPFGLSLLAVVRKSANNSGYGRAAAA
jgi:2-polyprenyl-3-methyl-5-hydroxy-6-metoxy-1,4-benzoquinol methylase